MIMTGDFFSFALKSNVTLKVFVPTREGEEQIVETDGEVTRDTFPVVYLLHGAYGNYHSWTRFSSIERYAQQHQCVVVMPSAENSFYHKLVDGRDFYTFVTQELRHNVNRVFPVSQQREDTFIAGFSMGGYGAWYLALNNPDIYAKAASLSGALDLSYLYQSERYGGDDGPINWKSMFEDPTQIEGSSSDLIHVYDTLTQQTQHSKPALYQSCGTEDPLYELNLSMKDRLLAMGCPLEYHFCEGYEHSWEFWDKDIQRVLEWLLPIQK